MHHDFWHRRWQKNEIGFHEPDGSHLLKTYFNQFELAEGARIFVPLCGKTKDIGWLLFKGFQVVAIELNETAVNALFDELGISPSVTEQDGFKLFSAPDLQVFVGDFFALQASHIGDIQGIYDRAALVALPDEMRIRYVQHLIDITHATQQFLVTYDYDPLLFSGPPFSVEKDAVNAYYHDLYNISMLFRDKVQGGFRGHSEVFESVYLLKPIRRPS
ncbi:thiopurine S-methyltransferase [Glaciecola sp. XM2]|jgi:thiopurine S-methyltransferase|uniref:thiopurine S-methyltransferase n=1 Tax=Glaciecola sp. XM2 TaxID=1914931 RepID=UPI001BDE2102|nr:thiopurine S-methyltransferase [Glaciecola sp. XM2]MBT1451752.1 thiopurine S-methyltransferase [Glaciecola sp. XM2]